MNIHCNTYFVLLYMKQFTYVDPVMLMYREDASVNAIIQRITLNDEPLDLLRAREAETTTAAAAVDSVAAPAFGGSNRSSSSSCRESECAGSTEEEDPDSADFMSLASAPVETHRLWAVKNPEVSTMLVFSCILSQPAHYLWRNLF